MSTTFRALRDSDGNIIDINKSYARGVTQSASVSTTSGATSANFTSGTQFVEIVSDVFCLYALGSSSVAATSSAGTPLPPNTPRIVPTGGADRIAGILTESSASGKLYATEL